MKDKLNEDEACQFFCENILISQEFAWFESISIKIPKQVVLLTPFLKNTELNENEIIARQII